MVLATKTTLTLSRHISDSLWRLPLAAILLIIASACSEDKKIDVLAGLNPKTMPTMRSENVATLVSDSGITQYKIVSPLWLVYEEAKEPYWSFPKGLYLRKYDRNFRVIATVACDSARYFKMRKLWRLDGNVEMTKVPKELFQTQQLFWDERRHEIHTDSFIHVQTPTHVLEGIGFRSNEKLTDYRVVRPTGIFPVESGLSSGASGAASTSQPAPGMVSPN